MFGTDASMQDYNRVDDPANSASFPMLLRVLRNPMAVVLATYVAYYSFGQVVLGDALVILFLEAPEFQNNRLWGVHGACGDFTGVSDIMIISCRLFFPKEVITIYLVPFSFLAFTAWAIMSIKARRFIFVLTRRQRKILIFTMYIAASLSIFMALAMLPRFFLFTGPTHGFHPFGPLIRVVCSFMSPIAFWLIIENMEKRYTGLVQESKNG